MTNTLLVPMAVDALIVGLQSSRSELRLLEPMADFSALPTGDEIGSRRRPYDSSQIGRRAPPFGGEVPARAGVHLHWALRRKPQTARRPGRTFQRQIDGLCPA